MSVTVTFGEVMLRANAPGFRRIAQSVPGTLECAFAGSEANVATIIAMLGGAARLVTAVPENDLGDACIRNLKGFGMDTSFIAQLDIGRMGLFFVETGAAQRGSSVLYDRGQSTFALTDPDCFDWPAVFQDADWFHVTGITPAVSMNSAIQTLQAVRIAKAAGLTVSCDINYRSKLWRWKPGTPPRTLARETMTEIVREVDLLIGNEADAEDVFGISVADTNVESGVLSTSGYERTAAELAAVFPNLKQIAFTLRGSVSATTNLWGAMLYDCSTRKSYFEPEVDGAYEPFEIGYIVDRIGAGDAFAGSLIHQLKSEDTPQLRQALSFAVSASCLAHSIAGDFCFVSSSEVRALAAGSRAGRVRR